MASFGIESSLFCVSRDLCTGEIENHPRETNLHHKIFSLSFDSFPFLNRWGLKEKIQRRRDVIYLMSQKLSLSLSLSLSSILSPQSSLFHFLSLVSADLLSEEDGASRKKNWVTKNRKPLFFLFLFLLYSFSSRQENRKTFFRGHRKREGFFLFLGCIRQIGMNQGKRKENRSGLNFMASQLGI